METTEQAWFLQVSFKRTSSFTPPSVGRARPEADVGSQARERGGREGSLRSRSLLHVAELQIEDLVFRLLLTLRLPSPSPSSTNGGCNPPLTRSLSSCPALLPSCDWFDSLLLLSHHGASVVTVVNGHPCLFFFYIYPYLKC